jgi:hypothetical protein
VKLISQKSRQLVPVLPDVTEKARACTFKFGSGFIVLIVKDLFLKKLPESLDGIQVWRISRQINKAGAELRRQFLDLRGAIISSIVHDKLDNFSRRILCTNSMQKLTDGGTVDSIRLSGDDLQRVDVDGPIDVETVSKAIVG